jgi:hypothetical protein
MNIESVTVLRDPETNEIINFDLRCCEGAYIVPVDPKNKHYAEIMRQVEAGTLVLQEFE